MSPSLVAGVFAALLLAAPAASVSVVSRDTPAIVTSYKTWIQTAPCFQDNNGGRALHHLASRSDTNTVFSCLDTCLAGGYVVGGVEFGTECWCGNSVGYSNRARPAADCSFACSGNSSQACGGPDALNMYHRGLNPPTMGPVTTVVQTYKNFHLTQCWKDDKFLSGGDRLLTHKPNTVIGDDNMTVQRCIDGCVASGYTSAGLEFSQECWCDNITFPPGDPADIADCNSPCTADARQYCGGPNRLLIYTAN